MAQLQAGVALRKTPSKTQPAAQDGSSGRGVAATPPAAAQMPKLRPAFSTPDAKPAASASQAAVPWAGGAAGLARRGSVPAAGPTGAQGRAASAAPAVPTSTSLKPVAPKAAPDVPLSPPPHPTVPNAPPSWLRRQSSDNSDEEEWETEPEPAARALAKPQPPPAPAVPAATRKPAYAPKQASAPAATEPAPVPPPAAAAARPAPKPSPKPEVEASWLRRPPSESGDESDEWDDEPAAVQKPAAAAGRIGGVRAEAPPVPQMKASAAAKPMPQPASFASPLKGVPAPQPGAAGAPPAVPDWRAQLKKAKPAAGEASPASGGEAAALAGSRRGMPCDWLRGGAAPASPTDAGVAGLNSLAADELARRLIDQLNGAQLVQFLAQSVSPAMLIQRLQQTH